MTVVKVSRSMAAFEYAADGVEGLIILNIRSGCFSGPNMANQNLGSLCLKMKVLMNLRTLTYEAARTIPGLVMATARIQWFARYSPETS